MKLCKSQSGFHSDASVLERRIVRHGKVDPPFRTMRERLDFIVSGAT
jgi:hypothetical protein